MFFIQSVLFLLPIIIYNQLKMKKFFLPTAITLLFSAIQILGCTKDEENDPEEPKTHEVPDLWIGTYTVDQVPAQAPLFYCLALKPDGKVISEGRGGNGISYYSTGTWNVTGDSVKITTTTLTSPSGTITQNLKFHFNKTNGKMTGGTWKDQSGASNSGTFPAMDRVN